MKHISKERRPLTRLLQARLQRHWSQRDVAAHLETSFVTVSRWERGVALPGIYYRQRLCDLFNKSAQELGLDFEEELEEAPDALSLQETPEQETPTPDVTLPLWSVPHRRNPFFTGREPIFLRLHTTLRQRQPMVLSQSAALCGLGGIGKTQIAIEYAYRYKEEYTAIFWINAETAECLFSSFIALAEFLNLPEKQEPGQQRIVAAVIRWLSNHDDWLLIFDNVEDIELLKKFLPPVQQGALLLTSRKQAFDFTTYLLRLETLSMEEGLQFFLRRARWEKEELLLIPEEEAAAREIVAEMDGLPLALDQAGAYLEVTRCRPSEYLQLLQISPLPLLTERESYAEHPLSVTRTFQLAFQQVEAINPEASELLSICAFLAPDAIPEMFFLEGASTLGSTFEAMARHPLRFHAALKALLSYSLVQRNPATQTITLHRLVRAVLKAELHEEVRQALRSRVLVTMTRLFPDDDVIPRYWQMCARLLPHALSILTEEEQRREEEIQLLSLMNNVAMYLSKRSRYAEAQTLFEKALQRAELVFGHQHPLVAYSIHGLARLHMDEGNYTEAKSLFEQAVSISEQALGTSHPLLATSLHSLGVLLCMQGNLASGKGLFERALVISEQVLGSDHPGVAKVLNSLANVACKQEEFEQAEQLYQRALQIIEHSLGQDHPDVAQELSNLATLASDQEKYEQAAPLFARAISILEKALGPEHPKLAFPLGGLGELLVRQGSYEQAAPLCQRALTIWQQTLGPEHPMVGCVLYVLGSIHRGQGDYEQAALFYQRALHPLEQSGHLELGNVLYEFALLRETQGKVQDAAHLYARSFHVREQTLGSEHPKTYEARERLAAVSLSPDQGR